MHSSYKSKGGHTRLFNALRYSWHGLRAAFQQEAAFRQELLLCALLVPAALWIADDLLELALLLGSLLLVLIVELMNSAVETLADAITRDEHPLIGRAKDIGSAAVLIALCLAALAWIAVIFD